MQISILQDLQYLK